MVDETYVKFAEDFNTITSVPLASHDNIIILRVFLILYTRTTIGLCYLWQ